MKVIMVTYDSLNRHFLAPYGNTWVKTPNFDRLKEKALVFEHNYVGSLPCMPARREMHTGRYNFLHRSWGPMEPFDDSMPEILKENDIHSHLVSDHNHYWEDGGATYHTRYTTWDCNRGQEGDPWKPMMDPPPMPEHMGSLWPQDHVNRQFIKTEADMPMTKTFDGGVEFLDLNHHMDNWFLHVETFDPHEPFYTMPEFLEIYEKEYDGPQFDWPTYSPVTEEERPFTEHVRKVYAALMTMCDKNLGRILDKMDEYGLWEDTLLIVNTDHGFMLSEHDWWGKSNSYYEEVCHTPLFIYDPRTKRTGRSKVLSTTIDLAPTVLDFFGLPIPKDMLGKSLLPVMKEDQKLRETVILGSHGAWICCTDGRYKYILAPIGENKPLNDYTLMPTHMRARFSPAELQDLELQEPFSFTKGCRTLKIADNPAGRMGSIPPSLRKMMAAAGGRRKAVMHMAKKYPTALYDLETDPGEENPIVNPELEAYFRKEITRHLIENDAPIEQYTRMGLEAEYAELTK